jgi:hypothetical protein
MGLPPRGMVRLPLNALLDDVWSQRSALPGKASDARQAGVGQGWGCGARSAQGTAGHHPHRVDR